MTEVKRACNRLASRVLFAGALTLLVALSAGAQDATAAQRWQPWIGCWQPPSGETTASESPRVCVIPASGGAGITIITFMNGKEMSRQQLDASGQQRAVERDGCGGWESSQFSADDRRVYLRSELTCAGPLKRVSSGVLAMSPEGDWIGVESVNAGGGTGLRVTRYRDAGVPVDVTPEIANAIGGRRVALETARIAAGAPIGEAAVIEATRHLNASVVQALLAERGQPFDLNASQLASLADAGVPGSVTDVMVALSYPHKFVLDQNARAVELRGADESSRTGTYGSGMLPGYYGRSTCSPFSSFYDPYQFGYGVIPFSYAISPNAYGFSRSSFGSSCGVYGFSPYGYGSYGYGSFGYGGYGYWGRGPYVIVRQGNAARPSGQAVNGSGYTRRGQSTGTSTRTGVSKGSGSTSSGTARASGSSGSTGRTAHRRP